jgi:hypothetical protein
MVSRVVRFEPSRDKATRLSLTQVVVLRRPLIFRSRLRQLLPGIRTALLSIESLVRVHVPLHLIANPQAAPLGSLPS